MASETEDRRRAAAVVQAEIDLLKASAHTINELLGTTSEMLVQLVRSFADDPPTQARVAHVVAEITEQWASRIEQIASEHPASKLN